MRIVIAGGGTTGHLSPGLALAEELKGHGGEVLFIGSARGPEARIVPSLGYRFKGVNVEGRGRGVLNVRNLRAAAKLVFGTLRCLVVIGRFHPSVVVGTGGYASLPAAFAARVLRIPLVVHEQNSVPGLANRVAGKFARSVGVSFPGTEKLFSAPARLVGNPVRPALLTLDRRERRSEGAAHFGLDPGKPTLLVFGGSQGAQSINEAASAAYDGLRSSGIQVLHLAGPAKVEATTRRIEEQVQEGDTLVYEVVGYTDAMDLAYSCSDLALCRSGASTIAELAAVGLPAVLVPLPISLDDDQRKNAEAVVEAGGALMVLDKALDSKVVVELGRALLLDPATLDQMEESIRTLARPNAAQDFAEMVLEVAT